MKNLVLIGKIPIQDAPPEMTDHPIMIIERYCDHLIAERRAKVFTLTERKQLFQVIHYVLWQQIKVPKPNIPKHLYWDDTPDPPSCLSIENGHVFRPGTERLCTPPDSFINVSDEEDIAKGYMLTKEEFEKTRYESNEVKELKGTLVRLLI